MTIRHRRSVTASFTAPSTSGTLGFRQQVTDTQGASAADTVLGVVGPR